MSSIKKVVCSVAIGALITKKAFASQVIQSHNEQLTGIRSLLAETKADQESEQIEQDTLLESEQFDGTMNEYPNLDESQASDSLLNQYPNSDNSQAFDLSFDQYPNLAELASRMETFPNLDDSQAIRDAFLNLDDSQAFEAIRDAFPNLDGSQAIRDVFPNLDDSQAFEAIRNMFPNLDESQAFEAIRNIFSNLDDSQAFEAIRDMFPNLVFDDSYAEESVFDGSYAEESVIDESYPDQSVIDGSYADELEQFDGTMNEYPNSDDSQALEAIRYMFPNLDDSQALEAIRDMFPNLDDSQIFEAIRDAFPNSDGNEIIENQDETDVASPDESIIDESYPDESVFDDSYADQLEFDLSSGSFGEDFLADFLAKAQGLSPTDEDGNEMIDPEFAARMMERIGEDQNLDESHAFDGIMDIFLNLDDSQAFDIDSEFAERMNEIIDGIIDEDQDLDAVRNLDEPQAPDTDPEFAERMKQRIDAIIDEIFDQDHLDESQALDLIMNEIQDHTGLSRQFVQSMNPIHNQPGSEQSIDDLIREARETLFAYKDEIERKQHGVEGAFDGLERAFTNQKTLSEAFANILMKHHNRISRAAERLKALSTRLRWYN